MHLLIVTHYFPPLETVAAFRPESWARYWARANHAVTVLTTPKSSLDGVVARKEDQPPGYAVVEVPPTLRRNARPGSGTGEARERVVPGRGVDFLKQLQRQLRRQLIGTLFDVHDLWIGPAYREAVRLHERNPFDAVVSTFGPPATHRIASRLKASHGVPWIADYRDLWADYFYPGRWPFTWITRRIEDRVVQRANLLTTTSEEWRQRLAARFPVPAATVENGFDAETFASTDPPPPRTDGRFRVLYTGTVYRGGRDPTPLFAAVSRLLASRPELARRLELLFVGDLEGVSALAGRYGLADIVRTLPPLPLAESLALQKDADLLLFLDWSRPVPGWLTAKLFEYVHSGTPILAIGASPEQTASRRIVELHAGVALGSDVPRIESTLVHLLEGGRLPYAPDPAILASYSREALAARLLELVEGVVRG